MEKHVMKSKTFWFGLCTALAPMFPVLKDTIVSNPQAVAAVWGTLAIVLRLVTKSKVILVP